MCYGVRKKGKDSLHTCHPELVHKHPAHVCRVSYMSLEWCDYTDPSLTTSLQGKQDVQGACALVWGGSPSSNLLEPHHRRDTSRTTPNSCEKTLNTLLSLR